MNRYPHLLQILQMFIIYAATQDSAGNFAAAQPGAWVEVGECREEPNGKGSKVMLPDGSLYQFSSLVYLPAGPYTLQPGQKIRVMDGSIQRFEGTVARLSNDRKNSRLWA